jgi:HAE1 family hydrophobic/amphiphilic exporter-1
VIEGGAGANGNRALALGVIGGMSIGTIALLFVVPAFFIVFQGLHERFQGKEKPAPAPSQTEGKSPSL